MKITSKDLFAQVKKQHETTLAAAFKSGNPEQIAEAMTAFFDGMNEAVLQKAAEEIDARNQDAAILSARGANVLTADERAYYEGLAAALKASDPRAAVANYEVAMPQTVIERIIGTIKKTHPLLDKLNFVSTAYLSRILVNAKPAQLATWGKITGAVQKEIEGGVQEIALTMCKLSAFLCISMDLVELGPEWMDAYARETLSEAIACACVGIIVGSCSITGFALNMANTIISIGGKSLMFTLVFTMITCMILGMGLPSIPSYIITSTIAAPALVQLGIPALVAHMFCFYFAMFANLTPPVALAAFAAAGIAGGSPMKTGWASVKLALAGFILPYMFVYNTDLLLLDTPLAKAIQVAVTAAVGVFLISTAVEGFLFTKVNIVLRIASLIGAYLLIDSGLVTDIAGIVICAVVFVFQKAAAKKSAPAAA